MEIDNNAFYFKLNNNDYKKLDIYTLCSLNRCLNYRRQLPKRILIALKFLNIFCIIFISSVFDEAYL